MTGPIARFRANSREHRASILVAALSSAFGVVLLQATAVLTTFITRSDVGASGTVRIMLSIVAGVFITIAVYVGAIVTANTFATIIAGRTRVIALLRLVGAGASSLRRSVAGEGFVVGVIGALLGAVAGTACTLFGLWLLTAGGTLPKLDYPIVQPVLAIPVGIVILTTWLASWTGSRRVLSVTPIQATGTSQEPSREQSLRRPFRNVAAIGLFVIGGVLLALGVLLGLVSPLGVLVGLIGGMVSFTGLILGAHLLMPPVLRLVVRMLGHSAPARLAAANAVRYPERSSRTTIGLVIGVTLITMFAVAAQSYQEIMLKAQSAQPDVYQGVGQIIAITIAVFSVLIGFSAVIAAVGMINNLSLSVLQRSRELGLLRALGFSRAQVRRMVVAESIQMTVAAVGTGLVLGVAYGWAGAQSLLGSLPGGGLILPSIPWALLGFTVVAAGILALLAAIAPTRRATNVAPVVALATE